MEKENEKEKEVNLRIDLNHAITDGRAIFDYLELFACVSNGEQIPEKYINING